MTTQKCKEIFKYNEELINVNYIFSLPDNSLG